MLRWGKEGRCVGPICLVHSMDSPLEHLLGSWKGPEAEEGLVCTKMEGKPVEMMEIKETIQTLPPDNKQ